MNNNNYYCYRLCCTSVHIDTIFNTNNLHVSGRDQCNNNKTNYMLVQ